MVAVLEINDLQITLLNEVGAVIYSQPAAAALRHKELVFGETALAVARVQPQNFNQRYFANVSAQPLPAALGLAHNHADLVYQHLKTIPFETDKPITLSVPIHWGNEQLGLLLGIFQELGVEVAGFVDSALTQALGHVEDDELSVLDLELHRLVLTKISYQTGLIEVVDHRVWEGRGYLHLIEGWMSLVADEYVQHTRFDPLHSGETEQQLLNQLTSWVHNFARTGKLASLRVSIENQDEPREIEVQPDLLINKLAQRMTAIELPTNLALSHQIQNIPGLASWTSQARLTSSREVDTKPLVHLKGPANLHNNYQTLAATLPPDSVARVSSANISTLPDSQVPEFKQSTKDEPATRVTHLLHNNRAQPIEHFHPAQHGQQLNRDTHTSSALEGLSVGDIVTIDDKSYTAISVAPNDG